MEFALDRADQLAQAALDAGVDVLIGQRELERARLGLVPDQPEPALDLRGLVRSDDSLLAEHPHMGDRAAHILEDQPRIEADRGRVRLGSGIRSARKPPRPPLLARFHQCSHGSVTNIP